ncbi:Choline transporter-like protein [Trichinella spiralis]|uniref:Choline transporter-like protein n=1 Tax=Trichinella spiralis TaxID=6334 RepID=A0ABR3KH28_TRISP
MKIKLFVRQRCSVAIRVAMVVRQQVGFVVSVVICLVVSIAWLCVMIAGGRLNTSRAVSNGKNARSG